ncbi:MAG: response regulator [Myxococcales bacterium]|nr:response regulator [Myxococcales bacterium]MCB9733737.1 response regulator [Deltaproteobacteria bacterium]
MSRSHDGPISTRERLSDTLTDLPTAPLPPPKRVRVSTLQDAETRRLREQEWVAAVERAEASARARSSFLATMSHEIRTPMMGLIGTLELVRGTTLNPEQQSLIDTATNSAEGLLGFLDHVLDFARLEMEQVTRRDLRVRVHDTLDEVVAASVPHAVHKGLSVWMTVDPGVPAEVEVDPLHLRQILGNLLSNAIKFTDHGEIVIRARYDATQQRLEVEVTDTGCGIPHEQQERVFSPFVRLDASATRRHGGVGLGLTVAGRLATLCGGDLLLSSEPGVGSTFTLTLPAKTTVARPLPDSRVEGRRVGFVGRELVYTRTIAPLLEALGCVPVRLTHDAAVANLVDQQVACVFAEPAAVFARLPSLPPDQAQHLVMVAAHEGAELPPIARDLARVVLPCSRKALYKVLVRALRPRGDDAPTTRALRRARARNLWVLVVEDNDVNRFIAQRLVEKQGYRCEAVSNGAEAVRAVASQAYDVVLMDCQMPVMDGYDAARQIRDEVVEQPIIIAMTANNQADERTLCIRAGMDDYLPKPLDLEAMGEMIDKHLAYRGR